MQKDSDTDNRKGSLISDRLIQGIRRNDPVAYEELNKICHSATSSFLSRNNWHVGGMNTSYYPQIAEDVLTYVVQKILQPDFEADKFQFEVAVRHSAYKNVAELIGVDDNFLRRILWVKKTCERYNISPTENNAGKIMDLHNFYHKTQIGYTEVYKALIYMRRSFGTISLCCSIGTVDEDMDGDEEILDR